MISQPFDWCYRINSKRLLIPDVKLKLFIGLQTFSIAVHSSSGELWNLFKNTESCQLQTKYIFTEKTITNKQRKKETSHARKRYHIFVEPFMEFFFVIETIFQCFTSFSFSLTIRTHIGCNYLTRIASIHTDLHDILSYFSFLSRTFA